MSYSEIGDVLPEIPTPEWSELAESNAVGEAAFELLKAATIYAHVAASILPTSRFGRDDAILTGLILKLSKLGKALVGMSATLGSDRQLALDREVLEASATLTYLLGDTDGSRFDQYVQDSLVAEREQLRLITKNVKDRGATWPIEESMTRSIERTAEVAGIADVTALPSRRAIGWPSTEFLIGLINPNGYPTYRNGSTVLHSRWHDLVRHHIQPDADGTFSLRFEDDHPRAEPLYAVGLMIVESLRSYLQRVRPEAVPRFSEGLVQLARDFIEIARIHGEILDGPAR
jgi:hypothetical protein